jgi:hypothetical protein
MNTKSSAPQRRKAVTRRKVPTGERWRPTWNDYAEVTTGLTEVQVVGFVSATILRNAAHNFVLTPYTIRAIAYAGLIGMAPGWRRALKPAFAWIDRYATAAALTAIEAALASGNIPLDPKFGLILRRALKTARAMGITPRILTAQLGSRRQSTA